jgi:stearoyl-CoA desaturase (delta-9 desaturase)
MTVQNRTVRPSWPVFSILIPLVAMGIGAPAAIVLACAEGLPIHVLVTAGVIAHITGLAVTMGYHRLFTHRSFQTSRPVEWALMICGCMSGQSSPFSWIANHRQHHRHSDRPGDPHSPHEGAPQRGWVRRFWHAHGGWTLFRLPTYDSALVRDLEQRRDLVWIDRHWYPWYLLGLALPAAVGYLIGGTAFDALMGLLWGGLLRNALSEQITSAINSVCHVWGSRAYETGEHSRNNFLMALLAFGEGWHNNHHAHPYSARHGFHWWQSDLTWNLLWVMERFGLVWDVKRPKLDVRTPKEVTVPETKAPVPSATAS